MPVNRTVKTEVRTCWVSWVRIISPYPESKSGWVPKFIEDVFVRKYICEIIFMRIRAGFSSDISESVEKCPVSQCGRICGRICQKVLYSGPSAYDFQNLTTSSCGRCLPVCKVWWRLLLSCDLSASNKLWLRIRVFNPPPTRLSTTFLSLWVGESAAATTGRPRIKHNTVHALAQHSFHQLSIR